MARKAVALVGAGGVGKSSILKFFEQDGYRVFPSISREYFKTWNFTKEQDYLNLSPEERGDFQRGMQTFYRAKYSEFWAQANNDEQDTITDRSNIDHMAYCLWGTKAHIPVQDYINNCLEFANTYYTHIIFIPYPQPWMVHRTIEDGFRNTDDNKNYSVSSIMYTTLNQASMLGKLKPHFIVIPATNQTPQEKYIQIRSYVNVLN